MQKSTVHRCTLPVDLYNRINPLSHITPFTPPKKTIEGINVAT